MIRKYGINYVPSRAVTLFDIVGFSLLTPFEQMTQLNSLSYSLNSAHAKILEQDVTIDFARSSSGDGFYVWNRDEGLEASVNLYHFMHIVLADNAIARSKSTSKAVPRLRACFHVGSCYEFHQAEGLNPTTHDFIVGDVTIELARMIEAALPGQILVGDFMADIETHLDNGEISVEPNVDAVTFLQRAQGNLSQLSGMELSGEKVTAIKCYLTGENMGPGEFAIAPSDNSRQARLVQSGVQRQGQYLSRNGAADSARYPGQEIAGCSANVSSAIATSRISMITGTT